MICDLLYIKRLLFIAGGLMIGVSCSKNEVLDATDDNMLLRFGVSNVATKAVVTNGVFLQPGTVFNVWGNFRAPNGSSSKVFEATPVSYNGTEWTYTNPQYWFPGNTYMFRALYPSGIANVSFDGAAFKIAGFDATQDIDLLLAAPEAIPCEVNQKMGKVQLNFRHLLSRVVFVGRSDETHLGKGRQVVIDEAILSGVRKTGDWNDTWTSTGSTDSYTAKNITLQPGGTHLFTNELFIPQDLSDCVLEIKFHYNVGEPKHFTRTVRLSGVSPKWEAGKSYRYPFTISEHIFFETPQLVPWEYAPVNGSDFNVDHLPN